MGFKEIWFWDDVMKNLKEFLDKVIRGVFDAFEDLIDWIRNMIL